LQCSILLLLALSEARRGPNAASAHPQQALHAPYLQAVPQLLAQLCGSGRRQRRRACGWLLRAAACLLLCCHNLG
jgi:hypothetical protein